MCKEQIKAEVENFLSSEEGGALLVDLLGQCLTELSQLDQPLISPSGTECPEGLRGFSQAGD